VPGMVNAGSLRKPSAALASPTAKAALFIALFLKPSCENAPRRNVRGVLRHFPAPGGWAEEPGLS
jgi:hypothetical protein